MRMDNFNIDSLLKVLLSSAPSRMQRMRVLNYQPMLDLLSQPLPLLHLKAHMQWIRHSLYPAVAIVRTNDKLGDPVRVRMLP